jgi:hypothetical protein
LFAVSLFEETTVCKDERAERKGELTERERERELSN